MSTMKKIVCVFMCILMVLSSVSAFAVAGSNVTYSFKYYTEKNDSHNADVFLDMADELLLANKETLHYEIKTPGLFGSEKTLLTIDFSSVNNICKTIDDYKNVLKLAGTFMGDLKDLDFSTWRTGMSREKTGDITVLNELIELVDANGSLIEKVCNSEADLGLAEPFFDVNAFLGEDGVSGFVKGIIVDLVYDKEENEAQYNAAYERAKNDIDSFIFTDLLNKYVSSAEGLLPGFTMNEKSTIEDIVIVAFGLVIDKYVAPFLKQFDIDLTAYGEDLKPLSALLNLKGDSYDFSKVRFTQGSSLLQQINNVIGEIVKQIVPSYTAWQKGDYTLIQDNVEGVFRFLAEGSGLIENVSALEDEELMFKVLSLILGKIGFDEGIENCRTLEDLAGVMLINFSEAIQTGVQYKGNEHYTVVLGDIVAWFLYDYIKLTDLSGTVYKAGGGKDIWEVLNFVCNYVLFDKHFAGFAGLSINKNDSLFTKIDKLIDCFGENKTVDFNSEAFLMGDGNQKGIIDIIFTLDLQQLIDVTAVKALNAADDVPVLEFIYKSLMHILNNWSGTQMIPDFVSNKPLNNALQNSNVSAMIKDAVHTINNRKSHAVPLAVFAVAVLLKGEAENKASIVVTADGKGGYTSSVKFDGVNLTKGKDYLLYEETNEDSVKFLTYRFTDKYTGKVTLPVLSKADTPVAEYKNGKITLSWAETKVAAEYEVYLSENGGSFRKIGAVNETSYTYENAKKGNNYEFRIKPVTVDGSGISYGIESDTCKISIKPDTVKNLKTTEITDKTVSLTWSKADGADKYLVYIYKNGAWSKLKTTTSTKYTAEGLSANTQYKFKVRSYASDGKIYGADSDALTVRTNLSKVKTLKAKDIKTSSVKLYWSKVSGADTYLVYQYSGGEWKRIAKTSDTSYTVKSLSANKTYKFKVRPYSSKTKVYGDYSSVINVVTVPATVKNLKTKDVKATSLSLSWSKVSGATAYQIFRSTDGENYTRIASVSGKTSYTDKKVKKNTKYYYKVRAYRKSGDNVYYGAFSSAVKVTTKKK